MSKEQNSNTNVKQAVPFFMVVDMEKSLDFYLNGLGFKITNHWKPNGKIEWCWLQLENASIMLQEYRQKPSADILGEGVSVYFICEDALKIYIQILSNGLKPSEPFVGNQQWVVGLKDPDGYNLFFESQTDIPEETVYSEWLKSN